MFNALFALCLIDQKFVNDSDDVTSNVGAN